MCDVGCVFWWVFDGIFFEFFYYFVYNYFNCFIIYNIILVFILLGVWFGFKLDDEFKKVVLCDEVKLVFGYKVSCECIGKEVNDYFCRNEFYVFLFFGRGCYNLVFCCFY